MTLDTVDTHDPGVLWRVMPRPALELVVADALSGRRRADGTIIAAIVPGG